MVPRTASPLIVQPVAYMPPSLSGLSTIESCQLVITRPPRPCLSSVCPEPRQKVQRKNAETVPAVPGRQTWEWLGRLEADALGREGLRDGFLHLVEDACPAGRNDDRYDQREQKGFHGFFPLTYSAGAAAA